MSFLNTPLLRMLSTRMAYTGERHAVLAQNVANIDTPKFRPRDLEPLAFKDLLVGGASRLPMMVTNPAHIARPGGLTTEFSAIEQAQTFEVKPNGNSVNLEDQMSKISENQLDFQMSSTVYRNMIGLFRTALGTGQ